MRKAIIFALAFLLLLPLVKADTYLTDCAELNVTGETYYLTTDIINSPASTCMDITADNIVLDCQGHTIDGVDSAPTYGIHAPTTTNITIKNCVMTDWWNGIFLSTSSSVTLSNITSNSNYRGIYLNSAGSNNVINTTTNANSYGIYIDNVGSNTLSNIKANSNSYGIYISWSNSNTIKNSIIQDNTYGIYLNSAGSNLIYNSLFNNTNNFYFGRTIYTNNWNTTRQEGTRIYSAGTEIGGNYWTNPDGNGYSDTCTDADKDGFCDDPYVLATDNVDYLALSDEYPPPTTTTLPPVHDVPLLSSTLVGLVIGFGILTFMLRTLFDIREPKKVIEYFIVLAVIVLTVISLIVLFA
jgi:parallel beta-helix repeat protein